jgi:hypothetical protein
MDSLLTGSWPGRAERPRDVGFAALNLDRSMPSVGREPRFELSISRRSVDHNRLNEALVDKGMQAVLHEIPRQPVMEKILTHLSLQGRARPGHVVG